MKCLFGLSYLDYVDLTSEQDERCCCSSCRDSYNTRPLVLAVVLFYNRDGVYRPCKTFDGERSRGNGSSGTIDDKCRPSSSAAEIKVFERLSSLTPPGEAGNSFWDISREQIFEISDTSCFQLASR